jgi:hypothetical protein
MIPLAYMPQRDAEVIFSVLGGLMIVSGLAAVRYRRRGVGGPMPTRFEAWLPIVAGAGVVAFGLLIEAESGSHPDHYGWGGAGGVWFVIGWSLLMTLFAWWGWRSRLGRLGETNRESAERWRRWHHGKKPEDPRQGGW